MKIVVIVRARNEESRVAAFCNAYQFCDEILIADGGSTDKTVEIASSIPKVSVRPFLKTIMGKNGIERNIDHEHIQFLIQWAEEREADWVIFDDLDMRPNYMLKEDGRKLIENCDDELIMIPKIYLWENDQYFPHMTKPGSDHIEWEPCLWAWNMHKVKFIMIDNTPHFGFSMDGVHMLDLNKSFRCFRLMPPYCALHFSWITPEMTKKHVEYYRDSGFIPNMQYPLHFAGPLEKLPGWARE